MLLAVLLLSLVSLSKCGTVHIYISPHGSDSNSGLDVSHPIATLDKARQLLDHSGISGNTVYVELMGGYYNLPSTLHFTHGYTQTVTFRAYNDQEVHVTGGKQIPASQFTRVTDSHILNILPQSARSKVLQVNLPKAGITNYGTISEFGFYRSRTSWLEIFINGNAAHLAQYPNKGFINVASVPGGKTGTTFTYNSHEDSKWVSEKEAWAYGFWYWSWADDAVKISHVDSHKHQITLAKPTHYGLRVGHYNPSRLTGYYDQGGYFRVFNVLSELDQPGEYYLDRSSGILYIWPDTKTGTLASSDVITVSLINDCISLDRGVKNLAFQGFTLEACRHEGFTGNNLQNIKVQTMEIKNLGSYAVHFPGSTHITVAQCLIHDTNGGIAVSGGDRKTLTPSGNLIVDNHVWQFARVGAVGYNAVSMGGVGNTMRYNHLHDGQYTGVVWGTYIACREKFAWKRVRYGPVSNAIFALQALKQGNDNIMEYNHIHHMCVNSSDCGAIMADRDWTGRGNVIRYNYIHDVLRFMPGADNRAIMLDDQFSSATIEHNVFFHNNYHANIGGGRDNIVRYNTFYMATGYPMQVDGRGLRHASTESQLRDKLKAVPYTSSIWASKYPKLAVIDSHNPVAPMGNQIYKNIFYNEHGNENVQFHGSGLNRKDYYDIHDNLRAKTRLDFWSPPNNDFRYTCEAGTWAHLHSVPQPIGINLVGPRHPPGPKHMQTGPGSVLNTTGNFPIAFCFALPTYYGTSGKVRRENYRITTSPKDNEAICPCGVYEVEPTS